jgi:thioredoxin-like negative regulator of GroEL
MSKFTYNLILIILQTSLIFTFKKQWWEDSKVLELTTTSFFDVVGHDKHVIVEFYTKWCGYCKRMAEDYEELNQHMKENRRDIIIARLEGDIQQTIAEYFEISSYPKVVMFHAGSEDINFFYGGYRTFEGFAKWIDDFCPVLEIADHEPKIEEPLTFLNDNGQKHIENHDNMEIVINQKKVLIEAETHHDHKRFGSLEEIKTELQSMQQRLQQAEDDLKKAKIEYLLPLRTEDEGSKPLELFDLIVILLTALTIFAVAFTFYRIYKKI